MPAKPLIFDNSNNEETESIMKLNSKSKKKGDESVFGQGRNEHETVKP